MPNPLVSIIIPVYNVEKYLKECLDSVVSQTYEQIEIITIDDGSTDNSLGILKEYASKYERFEVVSQKNSGQSSARNKGIEVSNGQYIYFLDSDDYILPNTIEKLIRKMKVNNLDIIRFAAEPFTTSSKYEVSKKKYNFDKYFNKHEIYDRNKFLKINLNAFSPSPVLFIVKKEVLLNNRLQFPTHFRMYEDELFTLELFLNINTAMYDPSPFYKRRYRHNSIMTSTTSKERLIKAFDTKCEIVKEMYLLMKSYTMSNEVKLIEERIKVNNKILMQTQNIDQKHKRTRMISINNYNIFEYYFYLTYYKFRNTMRNLRRLLTR